VDHFGRRAEIGDRQRNDHGDFEHRVPQHGLPPAEVGDDALEQRRPHCAGEVASTRYQRQGRSAPSVKPAADIDVHRRIDAAEADQTDEESVSDP
jgi:hypothetical protein